MPFNDPLDYPEEFYIVRPGIGSEIPNLYNYWHNLEYFVFRFLYEFNIWSENESNRW